MLYYYIKNKKQQQDIQCMYYIASERGGKLCLLKPQNDIRLLRRGATMVVATVAKANLIFHMNVTWACCHKTPSDDDTRLHWLGLSVLK